MSTLPAEWEPQKALWLTWPTNEKNWGNQLHNLRLFYIQLLQLVTRYQEVNLLIQQEDQTLYHELFQESQISDSQYKTHLIPIATNTIWMRDYGPYFLKNGDLVEFEFNAWGGKFPPFGLDNNVPSQISQNIKTLIPTQQLMSFPEIFEGGAIEINGKGLGITTQDCLLNLNRNSNEQQQELIENIKSALGIKRLIVLPHGLQNDHTDGHIDNFARFISPHQLLLVMPVDQDDPNFDPMRENQVYLETALGAGIEIIQLPSIRKEASIPYSYANFIFLNQAIILPEYEDDKSFHEVCSIFKKHLPNYTIESIQCELLIQEGGSLHCISKNQAEVLVN